MGSEIFYCSACGTLLRGRDFEKGKAFRFADRVSCDRCVDQVLGPVSAEEKARLLASARALAGGSGTHAAPPPVEVARPRKGDTERFRQPPSSRTPREALPPLPKAPAANGIWIAVGVAACVLVVGAIAASSAAKPPVPKPEGPPSVIEVVPEPLPPAPVPEREARPRPPATPVRREESAKQALDAAKAYAASRPDDLQGLLERATQAQLMGDGTALAAESKALVEDVRRRLREKSEADLAALDARLNDAIGREAFAEAAQSLAAAKLPADVAASRDARLELAVRTRWADVRPKLEAARRRGADAEAKTLADRVRSWARPGVVAELDRDLAAVVERDLPKELVEYRKRWAAATALLLPFDYAAALAELSRPAEGVAKEEAAADLASLQLAAEAAREGTALLSKWTRGMTVKVERLDADGSRSAIEGKVWRAGPHELELQSGGGLESIPMLWLAPSTLGEIFASRAAKKPSDALAASLLCALEGDFEGLARFGAPVPDKFKAAGAAIAGERLAGAEGEARRLFSDAEADFQLRASRLGAGPRYAALLQSHAATRLVRRLKPLLDERIETSREALLGSDFLSPAGSFRWLESSKERPESFVSAAEHPGEKASGNFVEAELWIPADPALRAWAYIGACCMETAAFRLQAPELQGGTSKEPLTCEPGSPHSLPVRLTLSLRAKHAAHGGPKEPTRWGWVALPLPKYSTAGTRRLRLVTEQQGFAAAALYLSAGRGAPPRDAELRELEKNRPAAEAPAPLGTFTRDVWSNVNGDRVAELTSNPAYPDRPTSSGSINVLEGPTFFADQYGSRLRGYVHPPTTGSYVFFLVSDDESELWLSSDEQPARKRMLMRTGGAAGVREWDSANARKSDPVALRAGRRYYLEVLHKDGGGNDHVSVGWQLPDGALERPIPGSRLSPWGSAPRRRPSGMLPAPSGQLLREFWTDVPGKEVSALKSHPAFPDRPSGSGFVTLFEGPTDFSDNYGSRLRGYLHPPVTGSYVFFLASDDHAELYLSVDERVEGKTLLLGTDDDSKPRQWDHKNARKSGPVMLRAGARYYVEVLHKDASQGDNVAVGWQLPDGSFERPIPASRLSPWTGVAGATGTLVRAVSAGLPSAATIDGIAFEGRDVAHVDWGLGQRMENQAVPLIPPAEGDKARMIRSSWWRHDGLGVSVGNLPAGNYAVYLWFWEDTHSQTFDIFLNDHKVRDRYASGPAGSWERLGPFPAVPGADGRVWIRTSAGADANLSAIEIWKGAVGR